jgi:hypothetical protein
MIKVSPNYHGVRVAKRPVRRKIHSHDRQTVSPRAELSGNEKISFSPRNAIVSSVDLSSLGRVTMTAFLHLRLS